MLLRISRLVPAVYGQPFSECSGTLLSTASGVLQRCGLIPSLRVPSELLMEASSWTEGRSCTELMGFLATSVGGLKADKRTKYLF